MNESYPASAICTQPFNGGLTINQICSSNQLLLFYMLLNSYVAANPKIGDPCGRIRPVKKASASYDFVVVGGGCAGAVVASRLSEISNWKVLLIEAGPDEPAGAEIPSFLQAYLKSPLDWQYYTTNESHACLAQGGKCYWPRGKNLAGCTAHHGMAYHRGHPKDYDNWAAMGNVGWSWDEVFPYFLKSEDNREIGRVSSEYHATGGLLPVERFPWQPQFAWDILEAGREKGYGVTEDMVGNQITGFTIAQTNSLNGVRVSNAAAFLRPFRDRPNLNIILNATVVKILFRGQRASGVKYYQDGKFRTVKVKREVIVSGGSINSPKLLLQSGIGPKEQLQLVGVPLVNDLPGVGENLHNHVSYGLDFTINEPSYYDLNVSTANQYVYNQTGPMSSTGLAQVTAVLCSNQTTADDPDLQLFFAGYQAVCTSSPGESDLRSYDNKRTVRFTSVYLHPRSRGRITLASKDPLDYPIIWGNDLAYVEEETALVEGLETIMSLINTTIMRSHNLTLVTSPLEECSQYEFTGNEYFRCAVHQDTRPENHQAGSCKMGPSNDSMAVVDPRLKVHGVEGVRVADASIMPRVVSGNPAGAITMIAERLALFVKEDWGVMNQSTPAKVKQPSRKRSLSARNAGTFRGEALRRARNRRGNMLQ